MLAELGHEALAEAHDLHVGLALRVEVAAALASAHGQAGEAVLEDLLKAEELYYRKVDGRVEPDASLVGSDRGVELDSVAAVDLDLSLVVDPGNSEDDLAFGLYDALEHAVLFVDGVCLKDGFQREQHFVYCLQEFRLVGVPLLCDCINFLCVFVGEHGSVSFPIAVPVPPGLD